MNKITKSLLAQKRARETIAGINHLLSKRPDQFSLGVWPSFFKKAKGAFIWDLDGNKYLDMSIGGIGATILGYADSDIDDEVKCVIDNGIASSLNAIEEVELSEMLCGLHPWAQKSKFTRSGGEAMSVAIRIARAATQKDIIIFCGYHGWHDWYLSANILNESNLDGHLLPGLSASGVPRCLQNTAIPFEYNNIESLVAVVNANRDNIAAIVMEPIRNISPEDDFLQNVKNIATQESVPLIFDEISSGFRMNSGGAHKIFDVNPDIAVFAKSLGNGYPIGAIIGTNKYMEAVNNSFISSTCWTERTGPAAALATIKKHVAENVGEHLMYIGKLVQDGWKSISEEVNLAICIGGIYPLSHFEFVVENEKHLELKAFYIQEMLNKGFLASNIFYAMYAHTSEDVEKYLLATKEVFITLKAVINSNVSVYSSLEGEPAVSGFKKMT